MRIFSRVLALKVLLAAAALSAFGSGESTPTTNAQGIHVADARQITAYLHQALDWHQHIGQEQQIATEPSDQVFLNNDGQISRQILQLAFDFARAQAKLLSGQKGSEAQQTQASARGDHEPLLQAAAKADADVKDTSTELAAAKQKLATARPGARNKFKSAVAELQSELSLAQSRSQVLQDMLQFVSGEGAGVEGGENLLAEIDQLQRAVPELESEAAKVAGTTNPPAAGATARPSQSTGIFGLVGDIFELHRKAAVLNEITRSTDTLADSSHALRRPFVENLKALIKRGDDLAKQADSSDPAQLVQVKQELDSLTAGFKQTSASVLPLQKQVVLFNLYKGNLANWRSAIRTEYGANLRSLLLRLVAFGLIIAALFVLAGIWRKATFRYVHDPHRRYQFLLLRRIVLWSAIAGVIALALATEIGSLATFAGLITAGIAVALQNVILAMAGYFFLIGKYGVRVGDRVQISGVTGDVVEIGLIRIHLMEVGGTGSGRQFTGRTVVFSNAVVFQPNASFFRQIPGTNFVWHQVSLTLAPGSDYAQAKKQMLEAVESVYAGYRERIEKQHEQMARLLNVEVLAPRPYSEFRMTPNGIEVIVCYPIDWEGAADIDDQVMRELLEMIHNTPELKLAGSGVPDIQPARPQNRAA